MKICCRCKVQKSLVDFNKKSASKDGRERYCKECHRELNRRHYKGNTQSYIDSATKHRIKTIEWYKELKGNLKCERCPESHIATLDFHHKDPTEKVGLVSKMVMDVSRTRALAEIAKCIVLCSNCHRKEHYTGVAQ
jgi:protein-arginine kinase activator protein McsA